MSYKNKSELPDNIRGVLPEHAQEIYRKAFNSAWDQYKRPEDRKDDADREEVSHKVAWSAVKQRYQKHPDGKWRVKD